jgi:predicted permease
MGMVSHLFESVAQDARYALRNLARKPLFATTVLLTLAIGIGATTAVFSAVDRILFRPLPYAQPQQLVSFGYLAPIDANEFYLGADYMDLKHFDRSPFSSVTAWSGMQSCDLTENKPARLACGRVESSFFATLGISPLLGRGFTVEEDLPSAAKTAVIGYGFWRKRFGGDPGVLGKTVLVDGEPVRIIGILSRDFEMPALAQADLLLPLQMDEARQQRPNSGAVVRSFARLKPGITPSQARQQMEPLFQNGLRYVPPAFRHEVRLSVRPLRDRLMSDSRVAAWTLFAAVVAVLLIACANIANLLLARSSARQQELAVRASLGASRTRLIRQALTESAVLGWIGAVAGCAVAYVLLTLFARMAPQGIPRIEEAGLDMRVLVFAVFTSLVCAILFGLAPALRTPWAKILAGTRATPAAPSTLRNVLVVVQIAFSIVLVSTAGLLLRSLWKLEAVPLGIRTDHVVTAQIQLGNRYQQPAQQAAFFRELEERLTRVPGVEHLAISDSVPPSGMVRSRPFSTMEVFGKPKYTEGTGGMVTWRSVTPEYFRTLGVSIVQGRGFTDADRNPTEHAIILSETLAKRLFGNEEPIGQRIHIQHYDQVPWFTTVGVAADVKNSGIATVPDPEYYWVRQANDAWPHSTAIIRTSLDPQTISTWVRSAVAELDPTLPIEITTLEEQVRKLQQRPRFDALLLAFFAGVALLLAAVGIYGVIALLVTQRTREIGVRMALGARRVHILRLIAGRGMAAILLSSAAGLVGAVFAARLLRSMLFGVDAVDPINLATAAAIVVAIAGVAMLLPAQTATKVDPMVALRYE